MKCKSLILISENSLIDTLEHLSFTKSRCLISNRCTSLLGKVVYTKYHIL